VKTLSVFAIANFVVFAIIGWLIMILSGVIHSYADGFPAFSFWISMLIGFIITVIMNLIRGTD